MAKTATQLLADIEAFAIEASIEAKRQDLESSLEIEAVQSPGGSLTKKDLGEAGGTGPGSKGFAYFNKTGKAPPNFVVGGVNVGGQYITKKQFHKGKIMSPSEMKEKNVKQPGNVEKVAKSAIGLATRQVEKAQAAVDSWSAEKKKQFDDFMKSEQVNNLKNNVDAVWKFMKNPGDKEAKNAFQQGYQKAFAAAQSAGSNVKKAYDSIKAQIEKSPRVQAAGEVAIGGAMVALGSIVWLVGMGSAMKAESLKEAFAKMFATELTEGTLQMAGLHMMYSGMKGLLKPDVSKEQLAEQGPKVIEQAVKEAASDTSSDSGGGSSGDSPSG